MEKDTKTFQFESQYGGTYMLKPEINMYAANNNLYLGFSHFDEEYQCWLPFCDATVNIDKLPYLFSAIDTNNNGDRFIEFLEQNGFGWDTGLPLCSGYCMYPVFEFNEEKLKEIDPKGFAEYQKAHGQGKQPLADKISEATARAGASAPDKQGKDLER